MKLVNSNLRLTLREKQVQALMPHFPGDVCMAKQRAKDSLAKSHPLIAKEAYNWDPAEVTAGSSKKLQWKCSKFPKHIWLATPGNRTYTSSGCPFCSGKKILKGFNDLSSRFPQVAKEAYGWDPTLVSPGEKKDRSWKCTKNQKHIWLARPANRTSNGTGCPFCAGQKVFKGDNDLATKFPKLAKEAYGWDPKTIVAGSAKNLRWRCREDSRHVWVARVESRSIRNYGCPFCSGKKLAPKSNDLKTTHPELAREAFGWDPKSLTASSTMKLLWKCRKNSKHIWTATPGDRSRKGIGCPNCAGKAITVGIDDLATKIPEIAAEAFGWNPNTFTSASGKKLKWKCSKKDSHIWVTSPASRTTGMKSGCPYCTNRKVLKGDNDLATTHPKLAKEAFGWDPTTVTAGMDDSKAWICKKNSDHKWNARIGHRAGSRETGCPNCAVSGFRPDKDGYLYFMSHKKWKLLQIGITNYPEVRIQQHISRGWELLELSKPMKGTSARKWEKSMLKALGNLGADLGNENVAGRFDGYTESWSKKTFNAKSLSELKAECVK